MHRTNRQPWTVTCGVAAILFVSVVSLHTFTQSPGSRPTEVGRRSVAGEVLVKFRTAPTDQELGVVHGQIDADRDQAIGSTGVRRFHSRSIDEATLLAFFHSHPNVEYAEPNYVVQATNVPNDPYFSQLWGLQNPVNVGADIGAVPAWDVSTGSRGIVVGVIDTGMDYTHQDLAANAWSAPASFTVTVGGAKITCAAGTHGFNALTMTCDPMDDHYHGTHVSGTIGAVGNNALGVVGVNRTTSIMAAKFMDASGSGTTANAVNAIDFMINTKKAFAATKGANVRVLSNSWGGAGFSQALLDEIKLANSNDMLFVAAAGNSASNNDTKPTYPASYAAPNVIAVAATDSGDLFAGFSNYGVSSVHLGAPGVGILSTTIGGNYATLSGTSMAAPHVAGAAALVLSSCALDTAGVKNTLLASVDVLGSLVGYTITGGRLNVNTAIHNCAPAPPATPLAPTGLAAAAGDAQVSLTWQPSTGASTYNVKRSTTSGTETLLISGVTSTGYTDLGATNGTKYFYVVSAASTAGESPNSNEASATPSAPAVVTPPAAPTGLVASTGPGVKKISLSWSRSTGATSYIVLRSTTSGGPYSVAASGVTATTYTNSGLTSRKTYYYVVSAANSVGTSDYSNQTSATAK